MRNSCREMCFKLKMLQNVGCAPFGATEEFKRKALDEGKEWDEEDRRCRRRERDAPHLFAYTL